jgi:hypothetical protein
MLHYIYNAHHLTSCGTLCDLHATVSLLFLQAIFAPFLLLTLPVAIPAGFVLASLLVGGCILKSFCVVLTPLLWPLWFLCAW